MDGSIFYASTRKVDSANKFLEKIGKKFIKFDKYDGIHGVREHIILLSSYFNKLKDLKFELVRNI